MWKRGSGPDGVRVFDVHNFVDNLGKTGDNFRDNTIFLPREDFFRSVSSLRGSVHQSIFSYFPEKIKH